MSFSQDVNIALACGYIQLTEEGEWALKQDAYELELQLGILQGPLDRDQYDSRPKQ